MLRDIRAPESQPCWNNYECDECKAGLPCFSAGYAPCRPCRGRMYPEWERVNGADRQVWRCSTCGVVGPGTSVEGTVKHG